MQKRHLFSLKKIFQAKRIYFILFCLLFPLFIQAQIVVDDNTPNGVEIFTVPAGVTSITVECIGGGGGGGNAAFSSAGGGGGGAYAKVILSVVPGATYSYSVANGGAAETNGEASSFGIGPTLAYATGGLGVGTDGPTGGSGGLASGSIGTTKFNGGTGGNTSLMFGLFPAGGGGGGGAGITGAGGNATNANPGAGTAPGGTGGDANGLADGFPGAPYGGGGSGASTAIAGTTGGAGANGLVRITYAPPCGPSVQPSNINFTGLSTTTASFTWTSGNGNGGEVVFIKQGSPIITDPTDATVYTANSIFGSGSQIGATGAFAVYSGLAGTATISNLIINTTYYYAIYTFNVAGPCYLMPTTLTGNFTTAGCTVLPTQASTPSFSCIGQTSMDLSFVRGTGTRVLVVAKAVSNVNADPVFGTVYTANSVFGTGSQIGIGNYVVYDGNTTGTVTVKITGLSPSTLYYFKIFEYYDTPNCYNTLNPASANQATLGGIYVSGINIQNTDPISPGALAQDIIRLKIVTSGGTINSVSLQNIVFTTNGSTNPTTDITNARIFYTGNSTIFSDKTQYGATFTTFGTNTASDNFALLNGDNYFWVVYDIKSSATAGNVLDATIESYDILQNGNLSTQIPNQIAPMGNRTLPTGTCAIATPVASGPIGGCNTATSQGDFINLITFGTTVGIHDYSNSSSCAPAISYYDKSATNIFQVLEGSTYTFSFTMIEALGIMNYQYALWIDWNGNGDFRDPGERYPAGAGALPKATTQNITIPVAVPGGIAMRLWVQNDTYPPDDCPYRANPGFLSMDLGQIMDLTLDVTNGTGVVPTGGTPVSCATTTPIISTPVTYTYGATATALTATGTNLLWYTSPTGGTGSATAITPSTIISGTTAYYVSQTNIVGTPTCESPRTQIAVNVGLPPEPTAPILTVLAQPTCIVGGNVEVTGLPTAGLWTLNPSATISSGTNYTFTDVLPGTYSYTVTNSLGCISPLSNSVTVNPSPTQPAGMSGIRNITPGAGAYPTFQAAIDSLNLYGVNGAITFDAVDAVYPEKLVFSKVCGASAVNTITFKTYCDICAVAEIQATGNITTNYTLKLDRGQYYIFDRIKFTALNATYSRVAELSNKASHNNFKNCTFEGMVTAGNRPDNILVFSDSQSILDINFSSNTFLYGSQGLYLKGNDAINLITGIVLNANTFTNQSYRGLSVINQDAIQLVSNQQTTTSTRADFTGFYLQTVKNASQINNNKLYLSSASGTGISFDNVLGTSSATANIYNNMIAIGSTSASYPIDIINTTGVNEYLTFAHNSLWNTSLTGAGFRINTANNFTIQNNSIQSNSALSYDITALTASTEDYNNFFPNYVSKNVNSITINPNYILNNDLHSETIALKVGTPSVFTTDIDGETRQNPPYIGADEFLGVVSWTGAVDADWNNTANWSSGQIPTIGTTVQIPVVAQFPSLNSNISKLAVARNILISTNAILTVPAAKFLTVDKLFTNNGTFTIKSNATGTGSFIPNGTVLGTGTNTIKQHLLKSKWHYIGSPISSASGVFVAPNYYEWDETIQDRWNQQNFVNWTDGITPTPTIMGWKPATDPMQIGKGYIFWHNKADYAVSFTGTFNNGDVVVNLSYTDHLGTPTQDIFDGWNLISNPYPSSVSWNSDGIVKNVMVDNAIYLYEDDGTGVYNNYKYYLKGSITSPYPSISLNASTNFCFLPPMQAVFVRANAPGGQITFKNTARAHTATPFYNPEFQAPEMLKISLQTTDYQDETAIRFIPESTDDYDGEFDAIKRFSSATVVPQIYSICPSTGLAINSLPTFQDEKIVPLGYRSGILGNVSISTKSFVFENGTNVFLVDKLKRKEIRLNENTVYNFFTEIGTFENRFEIKFVKNTTNIRQNTKPEITVFAVQRNLFVNLIDENINNKLFIYNQLGNLVYSKSIHKLKNTISVNLPTGTYFVKIISNKETKVTKVYFGN